MSESTVICDVKEEVRYCPAGTHIIDIGDADEGCLCPDCEQSMMTEGYD